MDEKVPPKDTGPEESFSFGDLPKKNGGSRKKDILDDILAQANQIISGKHDIAQKQVNRKKDINEFFRICESDYNSRDHLRFTQFSDELLTEYTTDELKEVL